MTVWYCPVCGAVAHFKPNGLTGGRHMDCSKRPAGWWQESNGNFDEHLKKRGKIVLDLMSWDDGQLLYTKGHHDPDEFCEKAELVYGGTVVKPCDVFQTYARFCGYFEDGKHQYNYLDYPVKKKRGAFPITYAEKFDCPEIEDYGI